MKRWQQILVNLVFYGCCVFVALVFFHVFVVVSFKIPSSSMYPTLRPGDFVLVDKLTGGVRLFDVKKALNREDVEIYRTPSWRNFHRNDVLVFNAPYPGLQTDSIRFDVMLYMVKRCVALPGDTFYIKNGHDYVAGKPEPIGYQAGQDEIERYDGRMLQDMRMNDLFPDEGALGWTLKDFGPLPIPKRGQTVRMDSAAWMLYRQLVEWEQKRELSIDSVGVVRLGGEVIEAYTFTHGYYFMAGDNAISSRDSRFWGLVPDDYIVGRVWRIWYSEDRQGSVRWKRIMKKVE